MKHCPMRQCVTCRARVAQADLVRLCWSGDGLADVSPRVGRGAYVHKGDCASRLRPSALAKALRRAISLSAIERFAERVV